MSVRVTHAADSAVQRVADATVWLLFRVNGVRSLSPVPARVRALPSPAHCQLVYTVGPRATGAGGSCGNGRRPPYRA